jgi:hypothetical protein
VKRSLRRFPNLVYGPAWQSANVWAPLRWKRAKIHRGSRPGTLGPHQEAGYTSAVVTVAPDPVSLLQSGGVHIRPYKTHNGSGAADIAAPHAICAREELICETDVSLGEGKPRPTDARPDAKTDHFETLGLFAHRPNVL